MEHIDNKHLIRIALQAGTLILESGGETYRAEDTIVHTALSLGAKNPSAFVTPTVIIFSYQDEDDQTHTATKRITSRNVNLKRITQVNALSRNLAQREQDTTPTQIEKMLDLIQHNPPYSTITTVLAAAFNSFFFALLFNGALDDIIASFIIGGVLSLFVYFVNKLPFNFFISALLSGGCVSILTELFSAWNLISSPLVVTSSVLMQVFPGIAIVNAIRDMIAGDLVSGGARSIEAFMIAAGLSVGSVFGLVVFSKFLIG